MGHNRKNRKIHIFKAVSYLLILSLVGCTSNLNSINIESEIILSEKLSINTNGIVKQIERSKMPDYGYRFANLEYSNQANSYATYYIREARKYAGLISNDDYITIPPVFLSRLEDESLFDLTDIYTTVMLVDLNSISNTAKKKISKYFDSLYDNKTGTYRLPNSINGDLYAENIYPTFLVEQVASLLNLKIKPVDKWLKEATTELFKPGNITRKNSSAYVMLIKLINSHHIKIPKKSIDLIEEMFANDLEDIAELIKTNEVYLPVYLMDYLEFSLLNNSDSSDHHNQIIDSILDENGIKDGVIKDNDSLGLYAAVYTLYLAGYNFMSNPNFSDVFEVYNSFLLDDSTYIAPGNVTSNFVDTYFVDSIIHALKLESPDGIDLYLKKQSNEILQQDPVIISHYLELLQRHNLMHIIDNEEQEIVDGLFSSMDYILATEVSSAEKLRYINAIIRGLEILEQDWSISKAQVEEMIDSFTEIDNIPENINNLIELVTFINFTNPNSDEIKQLCKEIVENITLLSDLNTSNKLYLQSKAFMLLRDLNYNIPNNVNENAKNILLHAQHTSGLFKGGDATEDVVSFRSTYYALLLQTFIN